MKIQTLSLQCRRFLKATAAVSALEYAILVGVVTVAIGAAVATFSDDLQAVIEEIGDDVATRGNLVDTSTAPAAPSP